MNDIMLQEDEAGTTSDDPAPSQPSTWYGHTKVPVPRNSVIDKDKNIAFRNLYGMKQMGCEGLKVRAYRPQRGWLIGCNLAHRNYNLETTPLGIGEPT